MSVGSMYISLSYVELLGAIPKNTIVALGLQITQSTSSLFTLGPKVGITRRLQCSYFFAYDIFFPIIIIYCPHLSPWVLTYCNTWSHRVLQSSQLPRFVKWPDGMRPCRLAAAAGMNHPDP